MKKLWSLLLLTTGLLLTGKDVIHEDFATSKADPQIYVRAAQKLGKRVEECMFVDDNVGAVSTAKQAGMIAVGIYDDSSKDLVEEMTAASDIYIYDFSEL